MIKTITCVIASTLLTESSLAASLGPLRQQGGLRGIRKYITCANGANVICNTGTGGCFDNSPVLCDKHASKDRIGDMYGLQKTIKCPNGENVACNAGTLGCVDNSPTLCSDDGWYTVFGESKTIKCPNGENVACNAGTLGCVDNSPTLCKNMQQDTHEPVEQTPMVGGAGGIGPAWTYDASVENPAGEKNMGTWTKAVYTAEQQQRLGVDEDGNKTSSVHHQQRQQQNVVGAPKTIKCPNGENVACNAGTLGCVDNSPTLCKDTQQRQQQNVVGAPKTIKCPNGENVACNAGTLGCVDNSPTLCAKVPIRRLRGLA